MWRHIIAVLSVIFLTVFGAIFFFFFFWCVKFTGLVIIFEVCFCFCPIGRGVTAKHKRIRECRQSGAELNGNQYKRRWSRRRKRFQVSSYAPRIVIGNYLQKNSPTFYALRNLFRLHWVSTFRRRSLLRSPYMSVLLSLKYRSIFPYAAGR